MTAALISAAAVATIPLLVGNAVNEGLVAHQWTRFGTYVGIVAVLGVVQAVASGARRWFNGVASRRVESEMRRSFHDHLLFLDVAYHTNINRGQLLSRVTSDLFQIQAVVASAPFWVANAALALAVGVILILLNPLLGIVAIAALPVVVVTSNRFSRRVREAISDLQRQRGALAGVVEETISGVRAVKGFGAEPMMEARMAGSAGAVWTEAMRVVRTRARYLPTLNTVPMMELAAVNWLGGYLVIHHRLSIGMLVAYNAYLATLTGPLQSIGAYIVMMQRAVVSGYRLHSIIARPSAVQEPAEPEPLPAGPGAVRFDGVSFFYGRPATPTGDPVTGPSPWRSPAHLWDREQKSGARGARPLRPVDSRGRGGRSGGGHWFGQDYRAVAPGPSLRPTGGVGDPRRGGRSPAQPARAASGGGCRVRGQLPVQRHHRRQLAGRAPLGHRRRAAGSGTFGPGGRVRRRAAIGLRHAGGRTGLRSVRRAAPAHRRGPGLAG